MGKNAGRNDPCPCGSGRKYKKCCLARDEAARPPLRVLPPRPPVPVSLRPAPPEPPHPAPSELAPNLPRHLAAWERDSFSSHLPVTPSNVAVLGVETILAQLVRMGVETDRDRFADQAKRSRGAWALSDEWREELGALSSEDEWFLGLAATELWKRWLPEVPCVETVDARLHEDYRTLDDLGLLDVARRWMAIWRDVEALLPDRIHTIEEADKIVPIHSSLTSWLADLGDVLADAAEEDEGLGRRADDLFADIRERFREDRSEAGEYLLYDHSNIVTKFDPERAEAILRTASEERPDAGAPVAFLSDFLARDETPEGLSRALESLEAARARPIRDADAWGLEERSVGFRQVLADRKASESEA